MFHQRHQKILFLSIVCIAIISLISAWNFTQVSIGPKLVLPSYPINLGRGKSGEILDGTFELWNLGGKDLEFRLQPS